MRKTLLHILRTWHPIGHDVLHTRVLSTSAVTSALDTNLTAWEAKARKEAKGQDPTTAFGHKTDDVCSGWG